MYSEEGSHSVLYQSPSGNTFSQWQTYKIIRVLAAMCMLEIITDKIALESIRSIQRIV
jgi:RNA processing factor Prp31